MSTQSIPVIESNEEQLITQVERRLALRYGHLQPEQISGAVQNACARFETSPIRDFIPLLVERRAGAELAETGE